MSTARRSVTAVTADVSETTVSETSRDLPRKSLRSPRMSASIPVSKSESENLTGGTSFETLRAWAHHTRAACSSATRGLDWRPEPRPPAGLLHKAGCEKLFTDIASGAKDEARTGRSDRLPPARRHPRRLEARPAGRSLKHLIETVTALQARKIGFRSLQESIDTTTSGGKLIFHVFGALAEFERDLIRERTQAGLQAARARGRKGVGRGRWTRRSWPRPGRCIRTRLTRSRPSAPRWGSPGRCSIGTWLRRMKKPESMATVRSHSARTEVGETIPPWPTATKCQIAPKKPRQRADNLRQGEGEGEEGEGDSLERGDTTPEMDDLLHEGCLSLLNGSADSVSALRSRCQQTRTTSKRNHRWRGSGTP